MTLAFEYANSKLVEVVTIADVDAERHVEAEFGADLEAEVWSLSYFFAQTLSTRFGQVKF